MSDKDLKNRYEKIASRRVKLGLLVTNIANTHNIEVTNEEISSGFYGSNSIEWLRKITAIQSKATSTWLELQLSSHIESND